MLKIIHGLLRKKKVRNLKGVAAIKKYGECLNKRERRNIRLEQQKKEIKIVC